MKKILFFAILLSVSNFWFIYAQSKGMVSTDILKIRSEPSVSSEALGTLKFGEIIYVYSTAGSDTVIENYYDRWFKISEKEDRWVNAFYVNIFPYYAYSIKNFLGFIQSIKILDYYIRDEHEFILCGPNEYRPENFELILFNHTMQDDDDRIVLMDNFGDRIYKFCDNVLKETQNVSGDTITVSPFNTFEYGIKVGMKKKDVLFILGTPFSEKNDMYNYVAQYQDGDINVYLYFSNDTVTKISVTKENTR